MSGPEEVKKEFSGKTVDEAIAEAAREFGVEPDDLEVEVLQEPGAITSLLGKRARISVALKGGNGFDPVAALTRIVSSILPETTVRSTESDDQMVLEIQGDGSGIFIGRKGATLDAIQLIMTRMAQKQDWEGKPILVESEQYRQRRADSLREKASQLADQVLTGGRPASTEMLEASERRIIHSEIKEIGGLTSRSIGNGDRKRVQVLPENRGGQTDGRGYGGQRSDRGQRGGGSRRNYQGPPRFED